MNQKTGLDYFPFDVDFFQDEKIQFVSARFGLKGEAITLKLLCKIYRQGYYINWDDDMALLFAKSVGDGCQHSLVNDLVNELLKRGFFDEDIFKRFSVLTSRGIQRRYFEATSRRKNVEYDSRFLLVDLAKYKNVVPLSQNVGILNEDENILEQRKVKESKGKKRKEEESKDAPHGFGDVFSLFEKCGFQITGYTADELLVLMEEYSKEWVMEAIKRSADRGKKTLGYVKGILGSWKTAGAMDNGRPAENQEERSPSYRMYEPDRKDKEVSSMPVELREKLKNMF